MAVRDVSAMAVRRDKYEQAALGLILLCGRDGIHKKKGRLRCHKRPKSREETPKEGSDSEALPHTPTKMIAISGAIEQT
jgi:hypothetical protein